MRPRLPVTVEAEPVTRSQHRLDDHGVTRVALDLAPQVLHVRIDGALVALELVAAYLVDELVARVDAAGNPGQREQHTPLGRRELDGLAPHDREVPVLVDHELTGTERLWSAAGRVAGPAPQDRLDAQHDLARAERLRHVVVGAEFEP